MNFGINSSLHELCSVLPSGSWDLMVFNNNPLVNAMACKKMWTYLELTRAIEIYLERFGATISHLKPFGAIWSHLQSFGATWSYLEPFGTTWSNLKQNVAI